MKRGIGGGLGLALLAFAFAYRWIGPEPLGLARNDHAPARAPAPETVAPEQAPPPFLAQAPVEGPPDSPAPPPAAPVEEATLTELSPETHAEIDDALTRAAASVAAGRLLEPPDDNALYWYDAALEIDPANRDANAGLDAVLAGLFERADAAIDQGEAKTAEDVLARIAGVERAKERAAELARRVELLPKVQELLREAAQRMVLGQRFEPPEASALSSYRQVRLLDPRNQAALQGLAEIERIVLEQALAAASEDQFADADRLSALASSILTGTQAQLETRTRIVELKRQRSETLLSRAVAALDSRKLDSAEALIARAESLGADAAAVEPLRARIADARTYAFLSPGKTLSDPFLQHAGSGPDLVVLPLGTYRMGTPENQPGLRENETPDHEVSIARAIALGRTEVTVAQFGAFARAADYETDAERTGTSSYYDEPTGRIATRKGMNWRRDFMGARARQEDPVVHVSWNDAQAYLAWLSERTGETYRLPTEAEFEYALRAGSQTRYPWGDGDPPMGTGNLTGAGDRSVSKRRWNAAFSNYGDGYWGPAPAGRFAANAFGLFDLEGNLSEWVEDCWHDSYLRAPDDGSAWVNRGCDRRVVRGGSWGSAPEQVRSAYRSGSPPNVRGARTGFRVARDL